MENISSSIVSDTIKMSKFPLTVNDSCSNLFLKEFIFDWGITSWFALLILLSFSKDFGSFYFYWMLDLTMTHLRIYQNVTALFTFSNYIIPLRKLILLKLYLRTPCPFWFGWSLARNKFDLHIFCVLEIESFQKYILPLKNCLPLLPFCDTVLPRVI